MSRASEKATDKAAENKADSDRRAEILRAAVEVFAAKGYHGCRIADVAKQAGVAYGLVYHYFQNKEELLESVFAESFGRWSKKAIEQIEGEGPVVVKLERIVRFAFESYRQDPRTMQVLIFEIVRSPAFRQADKRAAIQQLLEATAKLISRSQKAGELRDDVHPFIAASMLYGAMETTLTSFVLGSVITHKPDSIEMAVRHILSVFLAGMSLQAKSFPVALPAPTSQNGAKRG